MPLRMPNQCYKPSCGREGLGEGNPFLRPRKGNLQDVGFVFGRPQLVALQELQHRGEAFVQVLRDGLPSPAGVGDGRLLGQGRKAVSLRNVILERRQVVQMPDNRRIIVLSAALSCTDAPRERAQFIGGCFERVHAWDACHFRRLPLCRCNQGLDRPCDGLERRRVE